VLKAGRGRSVISYRLAQDSVLLLELLLILLPEPQMEQVSVQVPELLSVPPPLLGQLSVLEPLPGPVSESVCSQERQGPPYILSRLFPSLPNSEE
jgi:hypothetical protein